LNVNFAAAVRVVDPMLKPQKAADDANMLSAWICTGNDVLGNLAVLAAAGVFGTGAG
jgi:Co/Zn/Cd efflux system component